MLTGPKAVFWLVFAVFHASLVLWGSFDPNFFRSNAYLRPLAWYGEVSGAVSNVKFFSPNIGRQLGVSYRAMHGEKVLASGNLLTGRRETDLRVYKIISFFGNKNNTDKIHRSLAASWAGSVFMKHKDLDFDAVEIEVTLMNMPSMATFRAGERASWDRVYAAKFSRKDVKPE